MLFRYRAPLFALVTSCVIVFASLSVHWRHWEPNLLTTRSNFGRSCLWTLISFDAHDSCAETLLYRPVGLSSFSYFGTPEVPILDSGIGTVMCRLTTGIRSETCVVRRFCRCANVIECTYTNLDSIQVSQKECARLREGVPYVKVYRYNPKHLCTKLNGYGDNGQRKVWSSGGFTHCTCQLTTLSMSVLECGVILRKYSSRSL